MTAALDAKGQFWTWESEDVYNAYTGKLLGPGQRVLRFSKGPEYRWLFHGSAVNIGLAVVNTKPDGDVIVDMFRAVQDSL